ncbi:MAG TPA: GAF domain-containing SpoIIE family protein phosphatase [Candidatus Dormibacteraeota bacterium]|jgi:sigma-B regulation protein RsbU (phosphoserine phosphatase)|nr:GAF domain-containing SpoIIE family protein phosphatase [Candidatus Dormibacteraeota bacterium]
MEESAKLAQLPFFGEADPVPQSLFLSFPEQAKTLTLLYDISRELTAILDRETLLRSIAQHVKKLVNYHVFTVMLWNEKTQLLEGVFAMHYEDTIPARFRVKLGEGITGTAAESRRTLSIPDVRLDPRYIHCETSQGVRSELVVPLLLQDRLIGVLDLESAEPQAFTSEHERLLSALSAFIAIALENSRLYEEARRNEQRLLSELDTAREIQRQLLPRGAREVPGLDIAASYVPARELGGDFYDFLPYGNGKLALVLGDVSGKGTPAALFGSLAIGILREHVVEHPCPPAEMLKMLNGRLYAARLDARFVAMLFALYEADARRLTFASAGAPHPILVRNGKVEELVIEGVPLGLLPEIDYEILTLDLQQGDLLVFASDGIVESENPQNEEFGSERLFSILSKTSPTDSVEDISGAILLATDEFSGTAPPHDDRTLLVLRVQEEVSAADYARMPVIY